MLSIEEIINLKGKTVVNTGAASGMAKCAAELLLSLGAEVYAVDRNEVELAAKEAIIGDLSEKNAIDEVVSKLPEQVMYDLFLKSWNGRAGKPEEMGYPLVIIGSKLCSYMSGQVVYIDFGLTGKMDYHAACE